MAITTHAAIDEFRKTAADRFTIANDALIAAPNDKEKLANAMAAIGQLLSAETMKSTQLERDGYAEVVNLMRTAATHGETIANKLAATSTALAAGNANINNELEMMKVLTAALQAVAQVSPVAIWKKSTGG